jgi:hypothetical protein
MADDHERHLASTIRVIERSIEVERRIAESQPHLREQAERAIQAAEARLVRLRQLGRDDG